MARTLRYGIASLGLPEVWQEYPELRPRGAPVVADPAAEVRRALARPIGSATLGDCLRAGDRVTILVSDRTRPSGTEWFFGPILDEILQAGVDRDNVTVLFARGIHRAQTRDEQERILGSAPPPGVRLVDHDAYDSAKLVDVGSTSRGTPVRLHRLVVEANLRVVTGTASFHYFAGFGGGRKAIFPGTAAAESIAANHLRVLHPTRSGRASGVTAGRLTGNPVHEDLEEAALLAGESFLFNTVLSPEKELLAAFAGDLRLAHRAACDFYARAFSAPIERKHAAVVVSAGGHPRDVDFIQSHKALEYAAHALDEGGRMVALAACGDGLGSDHFARWLGRGSIEETERELRRNYQVYGQTALSTLWKARRFRISLRSSLDDALVRSMGMEPVHDLAALSLPDDTLIIPFGAVTLPHLAE